MRIYLILGKNFRFKSCADIYLYSARRLIKLTGTKINKVIFASPHLILCPHSENAFSMSILPQVGVTCN